MVVLIGFLMGLLREIAQWFVIASGDFVTFTTYNLDVATSWLQDILYFKLFGVMPIITVWILAGFGFCTVYFLALPLRMLPHTIKVIRGKYNAQNDTGTFTHMEAVCTAALGTVGLGTVAGVATSVAIGGPGAVFWMVVVGLFGISVKFAEVSISHKYRIINKISGSISGGPFEYIKIAFNHSLLGKSLGIFYAIALVGISITSSNMFQSNQTTMTMSDSFPVIGDYKQYFGIFLVLLVGSVIIGGARTIAKVSAFMVPIMSGVYLVLSVIVLSVNYSNIPAAICSIFSGAFSLSAAGGGMIGAIVQGATRSIYTTEAGVGTAGMAHAPSKTTESVREGLTVGLEGLIPIVVSLFTGLVITSTGVLSGYHGFGGIILTKSAFLTVSHWFGYAISVVIFFISMTTSMTWGYYGKLAWHNICGSKLDFLYYFLFLSATYYGAVSTSQDLILKLSDCFFLLATIPNLLALYVMSKEVGRDSDAYCKKLKSGTFDMQ